MTPQTHNNLKGLEEYLQGIDVLEDMDLLWNAIKTNNLSAIPIILPKTSLPHKNSLLVTSAIMGLTDVVLLLAPVCSQESINEACQRAVLYRKYDTAQALLPSVNAFFGSCLFAAISMSDDTTQSISFITLLIPKCSTDEINMALANAIKLRSFNTSKHLLPYADPKWNNSEALAWSLLVQNEDLVDLLYPLSDPLSVVKHLSPHSEHMAKIQQRIDAEQTKTTLLHKITQSAPSKKKKIL